MFGSDAPPANDSPPSPAKNLAAMCLMSCGPLPLMGLPQTPSQRTCSSSNATTTMPLPPSAAFFPSIASYSSSSSSATSVNPYALHHNQDFRKRPLPKQLESSATGDKQQRSASPPRLASIRSPPTLTAWRKPQPTLHSSILPNASPLFPSGLSSATEYSSASSGGASTAVPLTLPDMITPLHPSSSKSAAVENSASSLLPESGVLSEQALQATASKCAITSILFTPTNRSPGIVDPNLPPLIPAQSSTAIRAYSPMSAPPPPPAPSPASLLIDPPDAAQIPSQSRQPQYSAPPAAASASAAASSSSFASSVSAKRPAEVILLDDDDSPSVPLPLAASPQKRCTTENPLQERERVLTPASLF